MTRYGEPHGHGSLVKYSDNLRTVAKIIRESIGFHFKFSGIAAETQ